MSTGRRELSGLLRWYPPTWRARYGEEFVALMEDRLGGRRPTRRFRWSVAAAGLRQRARSAGQLGRRGSPSDRVRDGALVVLCSWTAFVVAGSSFAKQAEHFSFSLPPSRVRLPGAAFTTVEVAAVVAAALLSIGALAALPSFIRFLRSGGWVEVRTPVLSASTITVLVVGATIELVGWAHTLTFAERNGADWTYSAACLAWAAGVTLALVLWTAAAVRGGRRIELGRRLLGLEVLLAVGVALAMAVMTVATAVWWGVLSVDAPWFLQGTDPGTSPSPFEPRITLTVLLMVAATAFAGRGAARAGRSWSHLRAA